MRDLITTTNFYSEVVHSDIPLNDIFQTLTIIGNPKEYSLLLERYGERLECEFPATNKNVQMEDQSIFDFPDEIKGRIRIVFGVLMFLCNEEITYSQDLIEKAKEIIKENDKSSNFKIFFLS